MATRCCCCCNPSWGLKETPRHVSSPADRHRHPVSGRAVRRPAPGGQRRRRIPRALPGRGAHRRGPAGQLHRCASPTARLVQGRLCHELGHVALMCAGSRNGFNAPTCPPSLLRRHRRAVNRRGRGQPPSGGAPASIPPAAPCGGARPATLCGTGGSCGGARGASGNPRHRDARDCHALAASRAGGETCLLHPHAMRPNGFDLPAVTGKACARAWLAHLFSCRPSSPCLPQAQLYPKKKVVDNYGEGWGAGCRGCGG